MNDNKMNKSSSYQKPLDKIADKKGDIANKPKTPGQGQDRLQQKPGQSQNQPTNKGFGSNKSASGIKPEQTKDKDKRW